MKKTVFQLLGGLGDGGAETLVKDYALLLDKDKFDVKIITLYPPKIKTANYLSLRDNCIEIIPIIPCNPTLLTRILYKFFKKTFISFMFSKLLKRHYVDIIHVHMANLYMLPPNVNKLKHTRLLYTCHSLPDRYLGKETNPGEYNAAKLLIEQEGLQMIALHEEMRKEINKKFNIDSCIVINNGIDFNKYTPLTKVEEDRLRSETGLTKDNYVVGHVGRFSEVKNHKFILEIFSEVCKRKENARLLLIGNGPLEDEIKRQARGLGIDKKISILSHRNDVNRLLRLMDVFLFPSHYEGLSIALVEAQVSGLKCIVSDTVNPAAIFSKNAISLSLELSANEWCNAIFDESIENQYPGDAEKFNLRNEIKKVEKLYNNENIN